MPEHDIQFQGTPGSVTAESAEASCSSNTASFDNRVTACEKLVDEALEKNWTAAALADALKQLGLRAKLFSFTTFGGRSLLRR